MIPSGQFESSSQCFWQRGASLVLATYVRQGLRTGSARGERRYGAAAGGGTDGADAGAMRISARYTAPEMKKPFIQAFL